MIRRVVTAVRLFFKVQTRSLFPHIYFGLALLTVVLFRFVPSDELRAWLLPAFLLGEPGTLGLTLVAAQRYLEKSERNESALVVTPLRGSEYVVALVLATAVQGMLAGALIQAGVMGLDRRVLLIMPMLLLTAMMSGFAGLALSAYATEFTRFIVFGLVPAVTIVQLPLLSYLGFVPRAVFAWSPGDPALYGFALFSAHPFDLVRYALYLVALAFLTGVGFWWARSSFHTRIRAVVGQT